MNAVAISTGKYSTSETLAVYRRSEQVSCTVCTCFIYTGSQQSFFRKTECGVVQAVC